MTKIEMEILLNQAQILVALSVLLMPVSKEMGEITVAQATRIYEKVRKANDND